MWPVPLGKFLESEPELRVKSSGGSGPAFCTGQLWTKSYAEEVFTSSWRGGSSGLRTVLGGWVGGRHGEPSAFSNPPPPHPSTGDKGIRMFTARAFQSPCGSHYIRDHNNSNPLYLPSIHKLLDACKKITSFYPCSLTYFARKF